jgi:hypothetical protein
LGQLWREEAKGKPFGFQKEIRRYRIGNKEVSKEEIEKFEIKRDTSEEHMFKSMGIPDNDRLKYYQLLKKFLDDRMKGLDVEDFLEQSRIVYLKALWKTSYEASMNNAKVFDIEDEVVPLLLHTDCDNGHIPFPSLFINTRVQIKNRTYFGIFIGSFYTETEHYRGVFSCYSRIEIMKKDGKPMRTMNIDFFSLDPVKDIPVHDDYYTKKLKNYIFSFCRFINEPEVYTVNYPINPKNNIRRIDRGNLPLPEFKVVTIKGKLKEYIDKINQPQASGTGTRKAIGYKFWVRGFYRHYRNKVKYKKLYSLSPDILSVKGYIANNGIIERWVKPQVRGQGILINQTWEVKE